MKNLVLTFLLAFLVVVTVISVRRMVAGSAAVTGQGPILMAIGTDPVPPFPPPGVVGGNATETGRKPAVVAIGTDPVPPFPPPGRN